TSILEDSGYLARMAFLIDGLMHKIGLHGKSVVPFILGFGCSVPALYATRIIDNKNERTITGILIPFIPCSARTSVIFAIAAAFTGPVMALGVYLYVIVIIAINGKILSKFLSQPIGLILEIPSLKQPAAKIIFFKTWMKVRQFYKDAVLFLVGGSILLGWLEYFDISKYVNNFMAPFISFVLGLPKELGSTLVFGFFRKELILVMLTQATGATDIAHLPMSLHQIFVFLIFATLYFPCFTTFVVVIKEFGAKTAMYSAILSLIVASLSAIFFRILFQI
ncbi:MAG: nucleoside recognition domain-containing protein, partial [Bacteroidota bacterium]